jgi:NADH dehydrogenase
MSAHRVVILGGGFAGLSAALALRSTPADVTLIDRRNFHLFQPLLYQVATGSLSPGEISSPLRSTLSRQRNTRVLLEEVASIDPDARCVTFTDGNAVEYDTLVVGLGSITSYFGHDDWRKHALGLKSIEEATEMRRRVFTAFEKAELEGMKGPSPWLTFVIVGAGATGVELAGALSEISRKTLKDDFRAIDPDMAQILVLDQSSRVLPTFSPKLSAKAERELLKLGVRVRLGVSVTHVDENGVTLKTADGRTETIAAKTALWAGGVAAPPIAAALAQATNAKQIKGRIAVLPDLTIPGHPEIFVTGDLAALARPDGAHRGEMLPGVAQVAMQQGRYAGRQIARRLSGKQPLPPFSYFDRGDMAVIGRASAVANIFGFEVWGLPAWLVWLFIHLLYLVEFQSRIIVLVRWAFQYFSFRRGARLITGGDKSF